MDKNIVLRVEKVFILIMGNVLNIAQLGLSLIIILVSASNVSQLAVHAMDIPETNVCLAQIKI